MSVEQNCRLVYKIYLLHQPASPASPPTIAFINSTFLLHTWTITELYTFQTLEHLDEFKHIVFFTVTWVSPPQQY